MTHLRILAISLAGSSLVAVPAQAGGLLGGVGTNCLCRAANGIIGGAKSSATRGSHFGGLSNGAGRGSYRGMNRHGAVAGSVSTSVIGVVGIGSSRSVGRHHPSTRAIGLAGTVNSTSGLANVSVLNRKGASGRYLANVSALNGSGGLAGKVVNISVLNKTGTSGHSLANVAALNGSGGMAGKIVNVSALNRTGTTGRSLANVAILNGRGGTAGKVANVAILNKTGTNGKSLANVAVLNGTTGGSGRLANVAALNGHHGNGQGGLGLPRGVRIINGVPCGPDGRPLTGAAAVAVMATIGTKGGHGHGGSGGSNGGSPGGGTNAPQSEAPPSSVRPRERDMADRKDLWWPPHHQSYNPDGRLNDH